MKHSNGKRAVTSISKDGPIAIVKATAVPRPAPVLQSKEARNRANTIRNSVKVERYLMEVEKAQGFAKSWALRERLERGQVSLDELMRR